MARQNATPSGKGLLASGAGSRGWGPTGWRGWGPANNKRKQTESCAKAFSPFSCSSRPPPPRGRARAHAALARGGLAAKPQGADADKLAERIRACLAAGRAAEGAAAPKIDELTVAWALEAAAPPAPDAPRAARRGRRRHFIVPLIRVGTSDLYAGVATLSHGDGVYLALRARPTGAWAAVSSRSTRRIPTAASSPACPKGTLKQMPAGRARSSRARRATGGSTSRRSTGRRSRPRHGLPGRRRLPKDFVPTVFDNLIAKGDMPVTVGIFINPGVFADGRRQPQLRVRHALRPVRALPARGDPARGREDGQAAPRRGQPRHRRHQQRRHLRLHGRLGAPERVQQGPLLGRQLHQHRQRQDACARAATTTRR